METADNRSWGPMLRGEAKQARQQLQAIAELTERALGVGLDDPRPTRHRRVLRKLLQLADVHERALLAILRQEGDGYEVKRRDNS